MRPKIAETKRNPRPKGTRAHRASEEPQSPGTPSQESLLDGAQPHAPAVVPPSALPRGGTRGLHAAGAGEGGADLLRLLDLAGAIAGLPPLGQVIQARHGHLVEGAGPQRLQGPVACRGRER